MKKSFSCVLSLILAVSASASLSSGNISAYSQDNNESMYVQAQRSTFGDVFDEAEGEYIPWYSLTSFSSQDPVAYIPEKVKDNTIFDLMSYSCNCTNVESLVLPKTIKAISPDAFNSTQTLKYLTIPANVAVIGDQYFAQDVTIRGYIGSFAQRYAEKYGYDFQMIGDCDANGTINASDILKAKQYLLNTGETLTDDQAVLCDYNLDKKINVVDFIYIINNLISDKTVIYADPNKSAVASPDLSKTSRINNYSNEGFNDFTAKMISTLYKDNDTENEVCSPLSMYMALSQAAECSDSETLEEFLNVLGASSLEDLRTTNSSLFNSLYFDDLSSYMKIANSVWFYNRYKLEQETLDELSSSYFTAVFSEDFAKQAEVSSKINNWINDNTGGKLKPEFSIDPDNDMMAIINTVNFKDSWSENFTPAADAAFTKKDGSEEICKFLKKTFLFDKAGLGDDYTKFSVNMLDNFKMNFILPDEDSSVNEIISDPDTLSEIIDDTMTKKSVTVNFSVPKFDVKSKYDFSQTAEELGINCAFDPDAADFSRIIDPDKNGLGAYIGKIDHEAGISIDEQGCEAAAYSIITMEPTSLPSENNTIEFNLDRPFIYYVSDNNGTPVFMGIINDPTQN
ncbi:MAG: serpin family protein [Oscillospiraceae bacterium]|nr:serpin family protein [Oscillospiraceae bacterium]